MSADETQLRAAWQRCTGGSRAAQRVFESLLARHREAHRRYHGVRHVVWVVRHVDNLSRSEPVSDLGAIVAAAFFHDAVYEPASAGNEAASAALASRELTSLGWDADRVARVASMIDATAGHTRGHADADADADCDTRVLLDADLAVLASEPAAYQEYANGVRHEYAHVDDESWRAGRTAVLQGLLDRPSIYATDTARRAWEHAARANITAELASLR